MQRYSSIKVSLLVAIFLGSTLNGMGRLPVRVYAHHPSHAEEVGKAVVAVGCLAAIGYGLYKFCNWLFSKTDIQVLQEAQQVHASAARATSDYVDFFENKWGDLPSMSNAHKRELMRTRDEALLYQFAIAHAFKTSVEYTILSTINNHWSYAKSAHATVTERLYTLRKKPDVTGIVVQLEVVQLLLQDMIARLEFVSEYLDQHRSYYNLLLDEYKLMKQHEYELVVLQQYNQNPLMLREALRVAVMRQATSQMTYPYMNYIQKMRHSIQELEHCLNSLSCHYPERMATARNLASQLTAIYNMLIIEDAYRQELRDYERAQLEKQRIEAEQAKAAAAQAAAHAAQVQASAMQQQVWELQKQNQLYAQQNRIEQDRNVILTAQTIVNAVNPPVQEVYIYN